MNVSDIHATATKRTATTITNYPLNSASMIDFNEIYHDFCSDLRNINENYFYDRVFFDAVAYQNKYDLVVPTSSTRSIQKVLNVSIKYAPSNFSDFQPNYAYSQNEQIQRTADGKTYIAKTNFTSGPVFSATDRQQTYVGYQDARETAITLGNLDNNNYNYNYIYNPIITSDIAINPVFFMGQNRENDTTLGNSLYIYPYTQQAVVQGLMVDGITVENDLTTTSTEADIMIDRNYHGILVQGLKRKIFETQLKHNEAEAERQKYYQMKSKMLAQITDRSLAPNYVSTPYLVNLS